MGKYVYRIKTPSEVKDQAPEQTLKEEAPKTTKKSTKKAKPKSG
jgi:hypothetical protein